MHYIIDIFFELQKKQDHPFQFADKSNFKR